MVFRKRTVKNTRKFKPSSKTSIKTSTINKRSVGNNRTVKVSQKSQGEYQKSKTNKPMFPQPSSSYPGSLTQFVNADTDNSKSSQSQSQSSPSVTWDVSGSNTVYQPPKDYSSIYNETEYSIENSDKNNLLEPNSNAIQSRKIILEDKKKSYTEHTVNFKNLYGDDKITPVIVKTRGSHLNNDATIRRLAAMELQKKDAKINHGNVFNHVYNVSTNNYVGFKDPSVSNSKNLTDSNRNPRLVKTKAPRLFGDRELPGIGRISYTGFAGGKNDSGDPWKMTPRKEGYDKIKSFTVNNEKSPPMWVRGLIETPKTTRDSMISAKKDRLVSSEVFGSFNQYQEQESIDWSKGVNNYTNPKWTRQQEQMKIRQAENKEKERIKKLKKNKPPKGSNSLVILSWEEQTGLKY